MNRQINTNQIMEKSKAKEINLKELFEVIKRRYWIVVVLTVLFTIIGFVYSTASTTLLYQSSARIIINADSEEQKTLLVIMKDPTIMEKVVKELKLQTTPEALAGQITAQSINESKVVSIGVTYADPEMAAKIANTTAKVFQAEIPNIVDFNDVQLLSEAKSVPYPINDNRSKMIMIGLVFGVVAGVGLVFFLESLDESVKSKDDVDEFLGVPVLGTISKMNKKNLKKKNRSKKEAELKG
ncbi:Wzz/FepE/Etk N-terminal domain-containing protein [Niallia oryzisoli]|uniref:Wzz/FepE/Etk N-terminal domain-containing protein n=1 Tax=Niallia oryzisoli TaxID=1737571 RepID=A0ABZ2CB02_9BACI